MKLGAMFGIGFGLIGVAQALMVGNWSAAGWAASSAWWALMTSLICCALLKERS